MKKWSVYLLVLLMVITTTPLFGAEAFAPGKAFSGYIGAKQNGTAYPWGSIYAQYMRLYGTQTTYYYTFTGTPTANRTVNFGNPAASSYVQYTATAAGGTSTYVPFYNSSGQLAQDASFTYNSTTDLLTTYNLAATGLTSGRVTFATTGGQLTDDADMTFATNKLTVTNADVSTNLVVKSATASRVAVIGASQEVTSGTATVTPGTPLTSYQAMVFDSSSNNYGGGSTAWTITGASANYIYLSVTNANADVSANLASCTAGQIFATYNGTNQNWSLGVTGQTHDPLVAAGKMAMYVCNGTNVKKVGTAP